MTWVLYGSDHSRGTSGYFDVEMQGPILNDWHANKTLVDSDKLGQLRSRS